MYLALRGNATPPLEYIRVTVCERMGWTLSYFDSLTIHEVNEILAVWDGIERAQPKSKKGA